MVITHWSVCRCSACSHDRWCSLNWHPTSGWVPTPYWPTRRRTVPEAGTVRPIGNPATTRWAMTRTATMTTTTRRPAPDRVPPRQVPYHAALICISIMPAGAFLALLSDESCARRVSSVVISDRTSFLAGFSSAYRMAHYPIYPDKRERKFFLKERKLAQLNYVSNKGNRDCEIISARNILIAWLPYQIHYVRDYLRILTKGVK